MHGVPSHANWHTIGFEKDMLVHHIIICYIHCLQQQMQDMTNLYMSNLPQSFDETVRETPLHSLD